MTMSAAPMASGAMTPAPAPIPVQPIVRTRKKVPMNSAMYLFIVICYAKQLRGVGDDGANAESPPDKTVEGVRRSAFIVCDLLDPAFDKADAQAILESFDCQHFQVGQDAILITGGGILSVEFHLPDAGQFNVSLGKNFCVGNAGDERPGVLAEVDQSALFERSSRCPKCETEGKMISLTEVMACHDGCK